MAEAAFFMRLQSFYGMGALGLFILVCPFRAQMNIVDFPTRGAAPG